MGNITNLATTGNYAFEQGNLKVAFDFLIDKADQKLTRINYGVVTEADKQIANFNTDYGMMNEEGQRLHVNSAIGRMVELIMVINEAIASFEQKVAAGEL